MFRRFTGIVPLLVGLPAIIHAAPVTYRIDPARSVVAMTMLKAPSVAQRFSHDHAFRAPDVAGTINYDPANVGASKVEVVVQTATIIVDEPAQRERFGLLGSPSDKDKSVIGDEMRGEAFLWVAKYAAVSFASTSIKKNDDGKLAVDGELTLHGVTRPVSLISTIAVDGDTITGDGRLVIKQSDYGIKPCSKFLGAVKCADEVTLYLHLVGIP